MRARAVIILFILLLSMLPAYYLNLWLQRMIRPRDSFIQLLLYFLSALVLVFVYTYLVVSVIVWLFPPSLK